MPEQAQCPRSRERCGADCSGRSGESGEARHYNSVLCIAVSAVPTARAESCSCRSRTTRAMGIYGMFARCRSIVEACDGSLATRSTTTRGTIVRTVERP